MSSSIRCISDKIFRSPQNQEALPISRMNPKGIPYLSPGFSNPGISRPIQRWTPTGSRSTPAIFANRRSKGLRDPVGVDEFSSTHRRVQEPWAETLDPIGFAGSLTTQLADSASVAAVARPTRSVPRSTSAPRRCGEISAETISCRLTCECSRRSVAARRTSASEATFRPVPEHSRHGPGLPARRSASS